MGNTALSLPPRVPLADVVDGVYYINLDRRADRRRQIEGELQRLGVWQKARRVIAFDARTFRIDGFAACTRSHIWAIEDAIRRKFECVAIFEDDFEALDEISVPPSGFDVVQLSANLPPDDPMQFVDGADGSMVRVRRSLTSAGLVIHSKYFRTWRRILRESIRKNIPLDVHMQAYQRAGVWLTFVPPIARQRPNAGSDIS